MKGVNMKPIRNSVKAIIIENGKVLLNKCDFNDGKTSYLFSGGGQEIGETFVEALKRECLEELGAQVSVGELVWVREYIGKNHQFAESDSDMHQIEYYFTCKLETPVDLSKATNLDTVQVGVEWLDLSKLKEYTIYPAAMAECMDENGKIISPIYVGDVN
jgi:ADP-ribose pyrophosphatase YjhB (NUDIX family)